MSEINIFSPKLMLTQQTFDTCLFQFRSWLPTEYFVDNDTISIWIFGVVRYFCSLSVFGRMTTNDILYSFL